MFGRLGPLELILLLAVALLLFGRRLPEVGRSLGRGIIEFKKGLSGTEDPPAVDSARQLPAPGEQVAQPGVASQQTTPKH